MTAVVERIGEDDPKLVVFTPGTHMTRAQIEKAVAFQELPGITCTCGIPAP